MDMGIIWKGDCDSKNRMVDSTPTIRRKVASHVAWKSLLLVSSLENRFPSSCYPLSCWRHAAALPALPGIDLRLDAGTFCCSSFRTVKNVISDIVYITLYCSLSLSLAACQAKSSFMNYFSHLDTPHQSLSKWSSVISHCLFSILWEKWRPKAHKCCSHDTIVCFVIFRAIRDLHLWYTQRNIGIVISVT